MRSGSRPAARLPGEDALTAALAVALGAPVTVQERTRHARASTFPGEIVRCRTGDRTFAVLCKYEDGRRHPCFGHRGGPGYEAVVYQQLVSRLPLPTVAFHGSWSDPTSRDTWLFLAYLHDARRPDELPDPGTLLAGAARWAGRFHRWTEEQPDGERLPLTVYSGTYYAQWARRASEIAGNWHLRLPWLSDLCRRAEPVLHEMAELPTCAIHGEFTPDNLLVSGRQILPIDWETAAWGVGAVDLAALVDCWPEEVVLGCEQAYVDARWPEGASVEHGRTLDLARLYWHLRWLGDRPEWLQQPRMLQRYRAIRVIGERLGMV